MVNLVECLADCSKCIEVTILKVRANNKVKTRLAQLGIYPGAIVLKTREAPFSGAIEVEVKKSLLVIGNKLAKKIKVKCIE